MIRPALNKRIAAASAAAVMQVIFAFICFSAWGAMLFADRFIHWIFPIRIAFVDSTGFGFLCLSVWLFVSGVVNFRQISFAREIEDKLYKEPLSVKAFSDIRKNPGEKRLVRDIGALRRTRMYSSIVVLEDCIVFERGKDSRPFYLTAEKGMYFSEGAFRRDFLMPIVFFAVAFLQRYLPHNPPAVIIPLVFAALAFIFAGKSRTISYKQKAAPPPVIIEVEASGDSAADALIKEGREHLNELARLDALILDKALSKNIADITAATRQLLELLSQTPQKHAQARQLIEYALPTTIKLIKQYDYLERQPVKGDNIRKSMAKIVEMSGSVGEIMRKELDALYADRTVDIEVDIEVLKGMMQSDMEIKSKDFEI